MSNQMYQVICRDYKSHPISYGQCLVLLQSMQEEPRNCTLEHEIRPYVSIGQLLFTQPPAEHALPPLHDSPQG